jgi:NAD(P)-dependent dehydrogenase (short-subunit alcohol dehydrogenase family)
MGRLDGKVAVVTGAAGVLCSVMTESLLREGAKVALADLNEDHAKVLQKTLTGQGLGETLALGVNVLERGSLEVARDAILKKWGRIDILINGAGGNHPKGTCSAEQFVEGTKLEDSFFGLDLAGFEFVNKLNFIGSLLPAQVFCQPMLKTGGSVINISSMSATQPLTKVAAYSAAKAAIDNFTRWLAVHLAPANIRVNAIAPGFFITQQNRFLMLEQDGKTLTARGQKVINKTPMHRFGEPKDLCGALTYLVSDEASFVTGVVIPVDGGFLAYSGV